MTRIFFFFDTEGRTYLLIMGKLEHSQPILHLLSILQLQKATFLF
jgi:hypothetical protein